MVVNLMVDLGKEHLVCSDLVVEEVVLDKDCHTPDLARLVWLVVVRLELLLLNIQDKDTL
tara:strand:- start:114 stop:293 length:180 start_codon:yes stop_codon:yes gene_type:complete